MFQPLGASVMWASTSASLRQSVSTWSTSVTSNLIARVVTMKPGAEKSDTDGTSNLVGFLSLNRKKVRVPKQMLQ